jgi:hypothetical protein
MYLSRNTFDLFLKSLPFWKQLKSLVLSFCNNQGGFSIPISAPRLDKVEYFAMEHLPNSNLIDWDLPNLKELHLGPCSFSFSKDETRIGGLDGDTSFRSLVMRNNNKLEKLLLSGVFVQANTLLEFFNKPLPLQALVLRNIECPRTAKKHGNSLCIANPQQLKWEKTLEDVHWNQVQMKAFESLCTLDLVNCDFLSDEFVISLTKNTPNLTNLMIEFSAKWKNRNSLRGQSIGVALRHLSQLETLTLRGIDSVDSLAASAPEMPNLRTFQLVRSEIEDVVSFFGTLGTKWENLKELCLGKIE